jgi:transcription elongation factor GreA
MLSFPVRFWLYATIGIFYGGSNGCTYSHVENGKPEIAGKLADWNVDRIEVVRAIETAREHGNLKENAEYHAAKERQRHIEDEFSNSRTKLARAGIIDCLKVTKSAVFGTVVRLLDLDTDDGFPTSCGEVRCQTGLDFRTFILGQSMPEDRRRRDFARTQAGPEFEIIDIQPSSFS